MRVGFADWSSDLANQWYIDVNTRCCPAFTFVCGSLFCFKFECPYERPWDQICKARERNIQLYLGMWSFAFPIIFFSTSNALLYYSRRDVIIYFSFFFFLTFNALIYCSWKEDFGQHWGLVWKYVFISETMVSLPTFLAPLQKFTQTQFLLSI